MSKSALDPELLQAISQRITADAHTLASLGLIPADFAQRLLDYRLLPLDQVDASGRQAG